MEGVGGGGTLCRVPACSSRTAARTHPDRSSPCRSRHHRGRARQPTTQLSSRMSQRHQSRASQTPRQPRGGQWRHAHAHTTRRRPALPRVGGSTHRGSHQGPLPGGGSCTGSGAHCQPRPRRSSNHATVNAPQQNDIVTLVRRSLHSSIGGSCCLPATIDVHRSDRLWRGLVQSLSLRVQILEDADARNR